MMTDTVTRRQKTQAIKLVLKQLKFSNKPNKKPSTTAKNCMDL